MEEYNVVCLSRKEENLQNKVIISLLKIKKSSRIKLRSNLMELSKIPESKLKELVIKEFGKRSCDYALITSLSRNFEVLIPIKQSLNHGIVIYPRIARLISVQLLKRQERVEVEADAVFSRSLINEPLGNIPPYTYVYEGCIKVITANENEVIAVRILTDKGARVVLGNEIQFIVKEQDTVKMESKQSQGAIRKTRKARSKKRRRKKKRRLKKKR